MQIGQTFTVDGVEYSVKQIILPGKTDKHGVPYELGRVDASKFVGEGIARKIQKGRPKMFTYQDVANLLGEKTYVDTPQEIESDLDEASEENLSKWNTQRSDPEKVKQFIAKMGHDREEVPTDSDW